MKTSSVYQGFAEQNKAEIDRMKGEVLRICDAKKIYLLGLTRSQSRTESLFSIKGASRVWAEHCFLLVLVERGKEGLSAVQDRIENNLQHFIAVTAIVLCIDEFIQWLQEGQVFAGRVCEKASLIYEDDEQPLPFPKAVDEESAKRKNEVMFHQSRLKIESFLSGAELYRIRKEYRMSVFMLHQAAEQALRAMIMIYTGLRVVSHNLDKMMRYASMFCYEMPDVFSSREHRSRKLVKLLNEAYLGARYREEEYTVCGEELSMLFLKVSRIVELFEKYGL